MKTAFFTRIFLFGLLQLTSVVLYAHSGIDEKEKEVRNKNYKSLDEITSQFIEPGMSDDEKVHAIFDWVTNHISYDCKKAKKINKLSRKNAKRKKKKNLSKSYFNWTPLQIANYEKGICFDYSLLFQALCESQGIRSAIVMGFAKNAGYLAGKKFRPNHAWNSVTINDSTFYYDATWSSGYSPDSCKTFVHATDFVLYRMEKEKFELHHLCDVKSKDPVYTNYKNKFFEMPVIAKGYHMLDMNNFSPTKGIITMKSDSTLTFSFTSTQQPKKYSLENQQEEVIASGLLTKKDDSYSFEYKPEKPGTFFLYMYIDGLMSFCYKIKVTR